MQKLLRRIRVAVDQGALVLQGGQLSGPLRVALQKVGDLEPGRRAGSVEDRLQLADEALGGRSGSPSGALEPRQESWQWPAPVSMTAGPDLRSGPGARSVDDDQPLEASDVPTASADGDVVAGDGSPSSSGLVTGWTIRDGHMVIG